MSAPTWFWCFMVLLAVTAVANIVLSVCLRRWNVWRDQDR